ncbi:MAG: hypothetical protein R6V13_10210 [Anaerolineae bacterium]
MRWESLILLSAMAASLVPVNRWFSRRVQRLSLLIFGNGAAATYLYALLMLPGTLIHELSHYIVARLLAVKTGRISLVPQVSRDRNITLGTVQVAETDVVRASLVGVAPLLAGSALLVSIVRWGLGVTILTASAEGGIPEIGDLSEHPRSWLWLYLLLVTGNSMFPSPSDRRPWLAMGIYMGILLSTAALGLGMMGALPKLLTSPFADRALALLENIARSLALAFIYTLFVDLSVGGALWMLEELLSKLLGRSVVRR